MWAQMSRSGCAIVTIADATNVLGPGTTQREAGGNCIFATKDMSGAITANLTPDGGTPFNVMKFNVTQSPGNVVKDEPTIGEYAFSVTPKEGNGFTIFLLKGTWGATISMSQKAKLTEVQKAAMRRLAKSAISKM